MLLELTPNEVTFMDTWYSMYDPLYEEEFDFLSVEKAE